MKNTRKRVLHVALLLGISTLPAAAQAKGQLPPMPKGTPKVGEKAPDFTLPDKNEKLVKLSELLIRPAGKGAAEKSGQWVALVFYRGYW